MSGVGSPEGVALGGEMRLLFPPCFRSSMGKEWGKDRAWESALGVIQVYLLRKEESCRKKSQMLTETFGFGSIFMMWPL